MSPTMRVARVVAGAGIMSVVIWRLGTGPILDGLRTINAWSLAAAAVIGLVTTVGAAWRWSLVARGLGVAVPMRTAIAAYYRSQFLNTALPGGVLGDVHRGVRHGRDVGDVSRALRAVVWERFAGQAVQVALALVVLLALPSPVRSSMWIAVPAAGATVLIVVIARRLLPTRWTGTLGADVRAGMLTRHALPGITSASLLVIAGHTTTFLIAARTAGSTASVQQLLPLAMLIMLAMAVPANVGGWGPREGVTAALFGAAGLGADQGLAAATVYGVLTFAASLPGAVVLIVARRRHGTPVVDQPERVERNPLSRVNSVDQTRPALDA